MPVGGPAPVPRADQSSGCIPAEPYLLVGPVRVNEARPHAGFLKITFGVGNSAIRLALRKRYSQQEGKGGFCRVERGFGIKKMAGRL